jgi:Tol biopolymer transport system component
VLYRKVDAVPGLNWALEVIEKNSEIYVADRDGGNAMVLASHPAFDGWPLWSADGGRIVFNSDRDTPDQSAPWNQRWHEIWSVRGDGSDAVKHSDCHAVCTYGSLSPDGQQVLYRKVDAVPGLNWALEVIEKNSEIYVADRDGGNARVLASHPAFDGWPLWSPDGQWIVFASNRTGPSLTGQLWLVKPDGEGLKQITFGDWGHAQPSFTADGSALLAYRFQEHPEWEYGGVARIPLSMQE